MHRPDIDGLRAFAILPVVFYHTGIACPGGFAGVDVFFVISGYLISGMIYRDLLARRFSLVDFYMRRVRRLFPALFAMLLGTTIWAVWKMLFVDLVDYGHSLRATVLYLSNIYFYGESGYFADEATILPLLHTWSLAVEEQFYLVVPVLLWVLVAWVPRRARFWVLAGLVALSFWYCLRAADAEIEFAFYMTPTRAWELGIGGLLALAEPLALIGRRWAAEILGAGGLAAILYADVHLANYFPFPGWWTLLPTLGAAALLAAGGNPNTLIARFLGWRPFVFVGEISYPLYLWHWPVIVMTVYGPLEKLTYVQAAQVLLVSFALAIATKYLIEAPVRSRRVLARNWSLGLTAVAATALTVATGALFITTKGLPSRHVPALIALVREKHLMDMSRWQHPNRVCHLELERLLAEGRVCILGAENTAPSFVLAGDSHADAVSPAVFGAARTMGLAGYQFTMAGFLPTPGRNHLNKDDSALVDAFIKFVQDRPELRTVVVTAWWSRARTGVNYRNDIAVYVDEGYDGTGEAYDPISFDRGFTRLIEALPDRHIIFMDDGPSGRGLDVKSYLRTYAVDGKPPVAGLSADIAAKERALYEPQLRAFAQHFPNVTYMPVLDGLCGPTLCPLFDAEGQPYFRDGHHLSKIGAQSVEAAVLKGLRLAFAQKAAN